MADKQAERRRHKEKSKRLGKDEEARRLVIELLAKGWTPERISGWLRLVKHWLQISTAAIYRFIRSRLGIALGLHRCLPRHRKHRGRKDRKRAGKSLIPNRRAISERSRAAEERTEFGHWEGDTVIGKRSTGAMLTLVERKSRFLVTLKMPSTKKEAVTEALKEVIRENPGAFRSITFDNGLEFSGHEELHELDVETFFAEPFSPWLRGTNENTNGLLRRFIPKGTDLRGVSAQDVLDAASAINSWPKKCLEFYTPAEVFARLSENGEVDR